MFVTGVILNSASCRHSSLPLVLPKVLTAIPSRYVKNDLIRKPLQLAFVFTRSSNMSVIEYNYQCTESTFKEPHFLNFSANLVSRLVLLTTLPWFLFCLPYSLALTHSLASILV